MADNPNWETFLNKIPEAFREAVKPVLREWDQGVQAAFTERDNKIKALEPYQQFLDNGIEADYLVEAADLAYQFQQNPKAVVERANEVYELGFNLQGGQQQVPQDQTHNLNDDPELNSMTDIGEHPVVKQLLNQINELKSGFDEDRSMRSQQEQSQQFEKMLDAKEQEHKFDRGYVTAYMANGFTFDQALNSYNDMVAGVLGQQQSEGNNNQQQAGNTDDTGAPVVMGGAGAGSGSEQQPISFGKMKESDLEDLVANLINSSNSGQ